MSGPLSISFVKLRSCILSPLCTYIHPLLLHVATDGNSVKIKVPNDTRRGDVLIMFIGGSASGKKIPSDPGEDWEHIVGTGKEDLNLNSFRKVYEGTNGIEEIRSDTTSVMHDNVFERDENWKIEDGKNTFVSLVALRGIDVRSPIVDADAEEDTMSGREGAARAPSVRGEKGGIVLACFAYDDPHVATVKEKGFEMILSSDTGGDGMAIAVAETSDGRTGSIEAIGRREEKVWYNFIEKHLFFFLRDTTLMILF